MQARVGLQAVGRSVAYVRSIQPLNLQLNAGHGGVPLMILQDEPFFGHARFDLFYWRLRHSGLTKRNKPRPPFTTKPLRWPSD